LNNNYLILSSSVVLTKDNNSDRFGYYNKKINNVLLSNSLLKTFINRFWKEIFKKVEDSFLILLFKIKYQNIGWRTISNAQKVQYKDLKNIQDIFKYNLELKVNEYYTTPALELSISYIKIPQNKIKNNKSKLITIENHKTESFKFFGYSLPKTMDIQKYGILFKENNNNGIITFIVKKSKSDLYYWITKCEGFNDVVIKHQNKIILKFKDISNDPNNFESFTRFINDNEFIFINGKLILKKILKKTKFLKKINKKDNKITNKIITFDIETRDIKNEKIPYCICFYNGCEVKSFYLNDFKNIEDMIYNFLHQFL
jgi:hypothetical protein